MKSVKHPALKQIETANKAQTRLPRMRSCRFESKKSYNRQEFKNNAKNWDWN